MYSSPPLHGAVLVHTILDDADLRAQWFGEVRAMAERIIAMRALLRRHLEQLGSPRPWAHVTDQIGMFAFSGLSPENVDELAAKHSVRARARRAAASRFVSFGCGGEGSLRGSRAPRRECLRAPPPASILAHPLKTSPRFPLLPPPPCPPSRPKKIYMTRNGRISMAGVNSRNVARLAAAMHEVTKGAPE